MTIIFLVLLIVLLFIIYVYCRTMKFFWWINKARRPLNYAGRSAARTRTRWAAREAREYVFLLRKRSAGPGGYLFYEALEFLRRRRTANGPPKSDRDEKIKKKNKNKMQKKKTKNESKARRHESPRVFLSRGV